jgi:hypothetical protein
MFLFEARSRRFYGQEAEAGNSQESGFDPFSLTGFKYSMSFPFVG